MEGSPVHYRTVSSIPILYPLDASSKPPSSLIVVTTQICVQMSPGVEVGGGGWGWEQKSHMLENYWPIINRKKKIQNELEREVLFSSGLNLPIYWTWPQITFKRFCLLEKKGFNIYHLLVKLQKTHCTANSPSKHIYTFSQKWAHPCEHIHTVLTSWTKENAQNYFIYISYFIKYVDQTIPVPTKYKGILNLFNAIQIPQ